MLDVGGVASQVLFGSAILRVAPKGTAIPALDGTAVVWDAAFVKCGYTEDGVEMSYAPTVKDVKVDEEPAPVAQILDGEKGTISAKLAEATLAHMNKAISASTLTTTVASTGHAATAKLVVGTGNLTEMIVALEGVNEDGLPRYIIGYRAIAKANVQMAFKRAEKTLVPVEFELLADSTKALGARLFEAVDYTAPALP